VVVDSNHQEEHQRLDRWLPRVAAQRRAATAEQVQFLAVLVEQAPSRRVPARLAFIRG
jgi:hypothetical protein